jgi:peptide/nickel transport system permease protein
MTAVEHLDVPLHPSENESPDSTESQWRPPSSRRRRPRWDVTIAVVVIGLALAWALFPSWFTSVDPTAATPSVKLRGPSLEHLFGTDYLGRDMFSRVIYGARHSLTGSFIAVAVGLVLGSLTGLLAGAFGGLVDTVLMRVVDVLLAVPSFLLAVTIVVVLGFGTVNAALAVGLASSATFARLIRTEVLTVRSSLYVEAAISAGSRFGAILWRHILPNSTGTVLSLAALQFGTAILAIASLGFLGFGAQPPSSEWGLLVSEGRNYIASRYWLTLFPGLAIVAVVLATNRISHYLGERRRP